MSKLTDRISYLQGLAEGMKLNPEKDSHRLILGILEVLGEVGESFEALAEAHGELSEYVDSIDQDLADLEAEIYDEEDPECDGDCENCEDTECEFRGEDSMTYECPHCGAEIPIDPDDDDFDEDAVCPECGGKLFPEASESGEGKAEEESGDDGTEA